ncbi:MAG: SagB/ThcOx family dehydrogenase [Lentisphaerae bacterium]|nr:SagB/ThcOx family dehydrogenase [Lentisphaerota bacterium]
MIRLSLKRALAAALAAGWILAAGAAETGRDRALPAPRKGGGRPLMQALADRQSRRDIRPDRPLDPQVLADLLWAACGVNRRDSGKRTAPTARNRQEIEVYAALADGLFRYDAAAHRLVRVLDEDVRPSAGRQPFIHTAPLVLIYVADESRMGGGSERDTLFYSAADTGFVSQNVYLYCASEGLATVVIGMVDKPALAAAMKLPPAHKVMLTQPVGYPAE